MIAPFKYFAEHKPYFTIMTLSLKNIPWILNLWHQLKVDIQIIKPIFMSQCFFNETAHYIFL